ncbi:MAG: exonuclease domain-containing protein [Ignavibacteriales bacterium]|nr:exonuclease domain-containing protein [Ignavibacteriales bacterium]
MTDKNIFDLIIDEAEFCVLDVETTGMSPNNCRVIEIGIVKINNLKVTDRFHSLINPGTEIPYFITQLTGISNSDVYDAPYFDEIISKVQEFIKDTIIVAHNAQFDLSFLKREFNQCGIDKIPNPSLCTLKLARKLYPQFKSKSLGAMVKNLGITHKNVHRALGDASATAKILLKMLIELQENQNVHVVSDLLNYQYIPLLKENYKLIKKKLLNDFTRLPEAPGVYFFKNSKDEILYVGKAKSLKDRVKNYFSSTALSKSRKIVRQASKIEFETTNSELTALITEAELIKIHNPKHNYQLKKYGQTYFIRVNKNTRFANIESSSHFDLDGNDYFGPYSNQDTLKNLIELINKTFNLRECDDKEFAKLKECYLHQLHRCMAPCINQNISEHYIEELKLVYDFLSGKNQIALNRLINKMKDLSEKRKYEEAGQIRDLVNLILAQIHKTSVIAEPINTANVLIIVSGNGKNDFLLLSSGKLFIKDYLMNDLNLFDTAIEDYYNGTVSLFQEVDKKDLEKIKITLGWLIRNRTSVKVYYLKDYTSREQLFNSITQNQIIHSEQPVEYFDDVSE